MSCSPGKQNQLRILVAATLILFCHLAGAFSLQSQSGADFTLYFGSNPYGTVSRILYQTSPIQQIYWAYGDVTKAFTNQPPGHYVFELDTCINYGVEMGTHCDSLFGGMPKVEFTISTQDTPFETKPSILPSSEPDRLPYDMSVNRMGELNISIPIASPAGVNGLSPSISLNYVRRRDFDTFTPSTQDPTTPISTVDRNWKLSGFPAIRTCDRVGAAYCMGRDALIPEQAGSQLASWSKFRLENDPNIQFTLLKEPGTNQSYFLMKSGDRTHVFGISSEGRITRSNTRAQVSYWYLQEITDSFSNTLTIDYVKYSNSELYPIRIGYGGYQVEFKYAQREGAVTNKVGQYMLHTIRNVVNDVPTAEYRLASTLQAIPNGNSEAFFDKLQYCGFSQSGTSPTCTQPLSIQYEILELVTNDYRIFAKQIDNGFGNASVIVWENELVRDWQLFDERPLEAEYFADKSTYNCENYIYCSSEWQVKAIERPDGIGGISVTEYNYANLAPLNEVVRKKLPDGSYIYTKYHASSPYTEVSYDNTADLLDSRPIERLHYKSKYNGAENNELLGRQTYDWAVLISGTPADATYPYGNQRFRQAYLKTTKSFTYENGIEGVISVTKNVPTKNVTSGIVDQMVSEVSVGFGLNSDDTLQNVEKTTRTTTTFQHNTSSWVVGFLQNRKVEVYNVPYEAYETIDFTNYQEYATSLKVGMSVAFANTPHAVTTSVDYDGFGNLIATEVSGADFPSRTSSSSNFLDNRFPQTTTVDLSNIGPVYWATSTHNYDRRFGAVSRTTDPNSLTATINRDDLGKVTTSTGPTGTIVSTYHNLCGLPCGSVQGTAIMYEVVTETRHQNTSLAKGAPDSRTGYDGLGRVIRQQVEGFAGNWIKVDTVYNDLGQVYLRSLPYSSGTPKYVEFEYDIHGRLIRQIQPDETPGTKTDNPQVTIAYQQSGNLLVKETTNKVVRTDSYGNKHFKTQLRHEKYNGLGQLVESIDAVGTAEQVLTEYDYDTLGNLDWVRVNGDDRTVVISEFDLAGNVRKIIDPSAGETNFVYDGLGQLRRQTDARGIQTLFEYDLGGRLLKRTDDYMGTNPVVNEWIYDTRKIGQLSESKNPGFTENYYYNGFVQLESVDSDISLPTLARNYDTSFTYDDYGRALTQTYVQSGLTTYTQYNAHGYYQALRRNNAYGPVISQVIGADDFGNPTQKQIGGISSQRTFNEYGQLTAISSQNGLLQSHSYDWWSNNLLHERGRNFGALATETFSYDGLNRLTNATTQHIYGNRTLSYDYDLLGNLNEMRDFSGGLDVDSYSYGASNPYKLGSVSVNGVAQSYSYDASGNITSINSVKSNEDKTIAYNAFGKPVDIRKGTLSNNVISQPSAQDQFQYGADGSRFYKRTINKKIGIVMVGDITVIWPRPTVDQTLYLFGGSFEVVIPGEGINTAIEKVYLGDAMYIREVSLTGSSTRFEYLHTDHLGSVDVVTDENGAVVARNQFDPFGYRRNVDWTGIGNAQSVDFQNKHTNRGYTGHEQLDSTGLIHMNGRVYDPSVGRFVSADPIVQAPSYSQSYNRYSYVFNSPLSFTDPSGYQACWECYYNTMYTEANEMGAMDSELQALAWAGSVASSQASYSGALHRNPVPVTYSGGMIESHGMQLALNDMNNSGMRQGSVAIEDCTPTCPGSGSTNGGNVHPFVTNEAFEEYFGSRNAILDKIAALEGGTFYRGRSSDIAGLRSQLADLDHSFSCQLDQCGLITVAPEMYLLGGGGGIGALSRIAAANQMIFKTGHYASRLQAAGVNVVNTELTVGREIVGMRGNMVTNATVAGRLQVDGVLVEYRARMLSNGSVNIGTIFPVK